MWNLTTSKLAAAFIAALLALLTWTHSELKQKADLRDVERIEHKIDKLFECHMDGSCNRNK